jgi:hypothetical protein
MKHPSFLIGVVLGLTAGLTAFAYGTLHPTDTLPPTPSISRAG